MAGEPDHELPRPMSSTPTFGLNVMSTHMPPQPTIVKRAAQPYVAMRRSITMQTFNEIADRFPEVFGWLGARGVEPAGAPFFRYNLIDMERELEVEAGVPVVTAIAGDDRIIAGVLPAGRYATVSHVGHPDKLIDHTAALLQWAAEQSLDWDVSKTEDGERWGCRLELYKSDPAQQLDMSRWEVELAFKLAGPSGDPLGTTE
jgi:effector-binding domain-containing protein